MNGCMSAPAPSRCGLPVVCPNSWVHSIASWFGVNRTTARRGPGVLAQPMMPTPRRPHQLISPTTLTDPPMPSTRRKSASLLIENGISSLVKVPSWPNLAKPTSQATSVEPSASLHEFGHLDEDPVDADRVQLRRECGVLPDAEEMLHDRRLRWWWLGSVGVACSHGAEHGNCDQSSAASHFILLSCIGTCQHSWLII